MAIHGQGGQALLALCLGQDDSFARGSRECVAQLFWIAEFRNFLSTRLLGGLVCDPSPALHSFLCCDRKMRVRSPSNDWNNGRYSEFGTLLNRPLETIEFEDGEVEMNGGGARILGEYLRTAEREHHSLGLDLDDLA